MHDFSYLVFLADYPMFYSILALSSDGSFLFYQDSEAYIHWKGAAEIILASCSRYMDLNGQLQSIDGEKVEVIMFRSII